MQTFKPVELIRAYKWKSVFFYYFRSMVIIMMIVFVPYNIFLYSFYNVQIENERYRVENKMNELANDKLLKSMELFDILLSDFDSSYRIIDKDAYIRRFFSVSPDDFSLDASYIDEISSLLSTIANGSSAIERAYMYSFSCDYVISSEKNGLLSEFSSEEWYKLYVATKMDFVMAPRKVNSDEYNTLIICKKIYSQNNSQGIYCVEISYNAFEELIAKAFMDISDRFFLVSDINLILYDSDHKMINEIELPVEVRKALEQEGGSTYRDGDNIVTVSRSSNNHLRIVSISDYERFMGITGDRKHSLIENIPILVGIMPVFLVALVVSMMISYRMYKYIVEIVNALKDPSSEKRSSKIFGELFYIREKTDSISQERYERIVALRKAQAASLQAQINPHFLFNTLQLISAQILTEVRRDNKSIHLISLLSELMRQSYDMNNLIVNAEQEFRNVEMYLEIQRARYSRRLKTEQIISPQAIGEKTIKMILQPLIENSILHGLKDRDEPWKLKVTMEAGNSRVRLRVCDNGVGMEEEEINRLINSFEEEHPESNRIGLWNVNHRLQLMFGDDYTFQIHSTPDEGTAITVEHPHVTEEMARAFTVREEEMCRRRVYECTRM